MSSRTDPVEDWWQRWLELNEQYADAAEETMAAQGRVVEAWADSVEEATEEEYVDEGVNSLVRAHEIWMEAARETVEGMTDLVEGEDVDVERFRDTWLNAANQGFKETMRTAAFAEATGESVDELLDLKRRVDEATEATLHAWQLPALSDVEEVGARIVELERRQHAVEDRLETVLDALEDGE